MCEQRLQLSPERNALQQRTRRIQPRQAERQRRVHMEMAIDERRRNQLPIGIDHAPRLPLHTRLNSHDLAAGNGDILSLATIGKAGIADDEIERRGNCLWIRRSLIGMSSMPRWADKPLDRSKQRR